MKYRYFSALGVALLAAGLFNNSLKAQELLYELASPDPVQFGDFGGSLSDVPDVDGDGVADLVAGAFREADFRGQAHVFSGATGAALYTITGAEPNDVLGFYVGGSPDLNGDGMGEVLIKDSPDRDIVRVVNGATGTTLYTLTGRGEAFPGFGDALTGVGDLDGDGASEVLIGAPFEDMGANRDAGRIYLFSGATGRLRYSLRSPHRITDGHYGMDVDGIPDVDGDGVRDLAVGAPGEDSQDRHDGRAYIYGSRRGRLLFEVSSPDPKRSGEFGAQVVGLNDIDGDGRGDLMVGAPGEDFNTGHVYVFSGATGALLFQMESPNSSSLARFGRSIARISDVDRDGKDDLVAGAYLDVDNGVGRTYVFSGNDGSLLYTLVSPHEQQFGLFGDTVAGLGDVDGDGLGDIAVSATGENDDEGAVYVFSGGTEPL